MTSPGSVTWVGHATAVVDVGGFRVLTDPLLRKRVVHLRRRAAAPLPHALHPDLVLISHAHMDHLHVPSLRMVESSVPIVGPRGTRELLRRAGFEHVIEMAPGDETEVGPARITAIRAVHPSGRGPHTRVDSTPIGFTIDVAGHRTYFAGDTDLFDEMSDLEHVDLALLPIWGWGSTIGGGHLDPERAIRATELIRPGLVVPVHWGTYAPEDLRREPAWLTLPGLEFDRLASEYDIAAARVLLPGESTELPPGSRS
jgi:L-ascorbate metabolism protein UlaG (beta-lactamase superfamily)